MLAQSSLLLPVRDSNIQMNGLYRVSAEVKDVSLVTDRSCLLWFYVNSFISLLHKLPLEAQQLVLNSWQFLPQRARGLEPHEFAHFLEESLQAEQPRNYCVGRQSLILVLGKRIKQRIVANTALNSDSIKQVLLLIVVIRCRLQLRLTCILERYSGALWLIAACWVVVVPSFGGMIKL